MNGETKMIGENNMNELDSLNRRDALKGVAAVSLGLASDALGIPKTFGQTSVGGKYDRT